jgi:putative peptidoglycan lipid II flippase
MSSTRSVVLISMLAPASMVLGFASNWLIVITFGLSSALDAYFVAYLFPTLIGGLIADFLGRNFIPTLDRLKNERSKEEVDAFISTVINYASLASLIGMAALWLGLAPLIRLTAPGLDAQSAELTIAMAQIMSLAIVFFSVNTFHEYLHQSARSYIKPQLLKLAFPVFTLVGVATFGKTLGEMVLAWSFLSAYGLIFVLMLHGLNYRYRLIWTLRDPEVRAALVSSGWLILSGTLSRMRAFIERYLASQLGPGAVSALALAARISSPLQQGAALGMKVVAFRNASALVTAGRVEEAGRQSRQVVSIVIMALSPVAFWLAADADLLIAILFAARHLSGEEMNMLVDATRGFLIAAPLMAVGPILSNLYFVLNRPMVVVIAAPITLVAYLLFMLIYYEPLGVFGIALATFSIFAVSFLSITWHLSHLLQGFSLATLWLAVARHGSLAVACAWGSRQATDAAALPALAVFTIDGAVVAIVYFSVLYLLGDETIRLVVAKLRQHSRAESPPPEP